MHHFADIKAELEAGHDLCLGTIVNQLGSAPRGAGTSFLVRADGSIIGTIGGGRLEAEVTEEAGQVLADGEARLLHFRLKGQDVVDSEMICGGDVDVYLEPLRAGDDAAREIYAAADRVASRGGLALMVIPITPGPMPSLSGRRLLLGAGSDPLGGLERAPDLAEELLPSLEDMASSSNPGLWMHAGPDGSEQNLFLLPIKSRPVVYLFGGGHICLHLAPLIKMAGFGLVVVDDRKEYANHERFPQADEVWVRDFDSVLDGVTLPPESFVVIVTRGHIFDKDVLGQALKQNVAYVGMIGSRRKRAMIYQALEREGVSREEIASVHSPIGLAIGAETPEEIAISIVAELIAVRARILGDGPSKPLA